MAEGVSKGMFVVGMVIAIMTSILLSSVITSQLLVLQGPKGDKGDTGATGETGARGATGATGATGPPGFGTPDYDSGWTSIAAGETLNLAHALDTTNVYVYIVGKDAAGELHQRDYGWNPAGGIATNMFGVAWHSLNTDMISITRAPQDANWLEIRVMIWKIP